MTKIVIDISDKTYKTILNLNYIISVLIFNKEILEIIKAIKKGTVIYEDKTLGEWKVSSEEILKYQKLADEVMNSKQ